MKGRIIVSKEGINGTIEGTKSAVSKYCKAMKSDKRFADVVFKKSAGTGNAFPRLSVKARNELVTLGKDIKKFWQKKGRGTYIKPQELHKLLQNGENIKIIDMRNDYEHKVGHFEGSILPPMQNFRDLPKVVSKLNKYKNEKIVTVCTGGIRCEKASAFLKQKGFKDVSQLDGGIVTYMKKYPSKFFLGSLYVFDERVTMNYDEASKHKIIGTCGLCGVACERYLNCANNLCHLHFISCKKCSPENGYCSEKCLKEASVHGLIRKSR